MKQFDEFSITPLDVQFYTIPATQYRDFLCVAHDMGLEVIDSICRNGRAWFYVTGGKCEAFRSAIRSKFGLPL